MCVFVRECLCVSFMFFLCKRNISVSLVFILTKSQILHEQRTSESPCYVSNTIGVDLIALVFHNTILSSRSFINVMLARQPGTIYKIFLVFSVSLFEVIRTVITKKKKKPCSAI